jgi:hypothetical protein
VLNRSARLSDLGEFPTQSAIVGIAEDRVWVVVVFPMVDRVIARFFQIADSVSCHDPIVRHRNRSAQYDVRPTI